MTDAPSPLRRAIAAIYDQVAAPGWVAPNLDGLADVLRDLSWLPDGEVVITVSDLPLDAGGPDADRLRLVLERAVRDSAHGTHPIVLGGRP